MRQKQKLVGIIIGAPENGALGFSSGQVRNISAGRERILNERIAAS